MIQTSVADGRGGRRELTVHDPEYWEGPYRYEPYPKALYRQTQPGEGFETRVVKSKEEHDRLGSDWHESPADAKTMFELREAEIAELAARRLTTDARMSAKARAEALTADRAADAMLAEIPETPRRKGSAS